MAMKNIAGQAVRGNDYYKRSYLINQLWKKIKSGSSILISAPRRVGKTSLMYYIQDNPKPGYHFIYLITESVNNENEYFKRILNKIFETDFVDTFKKLSTRAIQILRDRARRINEIGKTIKFDKKSKIDYKEELTDLIKSVDLRGEKIVIMVDEFSQTIENIIEDEGIPAAKRFLQANRELRQTPEINNKIQFIYTGSIGLENIVHRMNAVHLINDLDSLKVPPLKNGEAHQLIMNVLEGAPFTLNRTLRAYILKKIEWLIPFYLQLALWEIGIIYEEDEKASINKAIVDQAFQQLLERRNCFEHWHTRLRKAYKKEEYNFTKELLNYISEKEEIAAKEIHNLAEKMAVVDSYKDIVNSLVYDGYINNSDDPKIYRFNSPLLKIWWCKNVAS